MHGEQRRRRAKFHHKVAVAHRVHRILGQTVKAEQPRHHLAVQRQGGTGQRAAAEGADVRAPVAVEQPALVALQHFDVGQQMMRQINRLGALQMGVAGDEHVGILPSQSDQRGLQPVDGEAQRNNFLAQPQPHVQRDLIVARAARVQLITPIFFSMAAWASEPRMSCSQSLQSKETDWVNRAAPALTSPPNRPLRETGERLFMPCCQCAGAASECHASNKRRRQNAEDRMPRRTL